MTHFLRILVLLSVWGITSCTQGNGDYQTKANNPEYLHAGVRRLTDIIRHDIFAPPISARIYTYSTIAAYEAMVPGFPDYQSMAGQLNGLTPVPAPESGKDYCYPLAGISSMLMVGKALVFSESDIQALEDEQLESFKKMNMPQDVYDRSVAYGETVAKHILAWAKQDNYAQTRSAPKFTIDTKVPARWRPTPPMYADGLEPHWCEIRPWVLDSCGQFEAIDPVDFSVEKGSDFYKQAETVYLAIKNLTPEQEAIAWYWDDNPFAMEVQGHLSIGRKKISPGGHWMNITAHACRKAGVDMIRSAEVYAKVACALADGFISCWNTKYKTALIRPESYINQYIDPEWKPLIQTPPFPEHTSGHSTISAAAAAVLTSAFGDNFAFSDSTEMEFGLPSRSFPSFRAAADEVAMSRLYGGIHYPRGNEAGLENGWQIGQYVWETVKTRKVPTN